MGSLRAEMREELRDIRASMDRMETELRASLDRVETKVDEVRGYLRFNPSAPHNGISPKE